MKYIDGEDFIIISILILLLIIGWYIIALNFGEQRRLDCLANRSSSFFGITQIVCE